jgi:hypothetical protein
MSLLRINRRPSSRDLRVFATLSFAFGAGVAWFAGVRGWEVAAFLAAAVGIAIGAAGWWRPQSVRGVYLAACFAVWPVGFVVSHLLLAGIYFLVVTPIGLLLRLAGKDPLQRRFDPRRPTYWTDRDAPRSPESYFRQS